MLLEWNSALIAYDLWASGRLGKLSWSRELPTQLCRSQSILDEGFPELWSFLGVICALHPCSVSKPNKLIGSLWWLLLDFYFSLLLGHCEEGVDMSTPWEGILKIPYQSWVQRTGKFGFEMLKQPCHPRRQYSVTMCCVFELCCVRASEVWWRMLTYEF